MLNEQASTSIQWMDQQTNWWSNPFNLVNEKTPQTGNAVWAVWHKSAIDLIASFIARISWNPDPFTWEGSVTVTPKSKFQVITQTTTPVINTPTQTTTAPVTSTDWWLFGKFSSTLTNIWNVVENLWNKAVWEATNVVNQGLEKAGTVWEKALWSATDVVNKGLNTAWNVWEQVLNKAQEVAATTTDTVTDFVKLEEPKKEWDVTTQQ